VCSESVRACEAHVARLYVRSTRGRWGRFDVPAWSLVGSQSTARFCPQCWMEDRYLRLAWRLRDTSHCWVHGCALRDRCLECKTKLRVVDLVRGKCRCGAALNPKRSAEGDPAATSVGLEASGLAAASREALACYLVLTRLAARLNLRARPARDDAQVLQRLLMATAGERLVLGTTTLIRAFAQLRDQVELDEALRLALQAHSEEIARSTVLSALPLWDLARALVRRGASPCVPIRLGLIDLQAIVVRRPSHTGSSCARYSALTRSSTVVVDLERLAASPSALELRGFDDWRVRRAELPAPVVLGSSLRMTTSELNDCLDDLRAVARPVEECLVAVISLDCPEIWSPARRSRIAEVLEELRCGVLPVWERPGRDGFGRFYVGRDVVSRLQSAAPWPRSRTCSAQMCLSV
jgi:hypothetical protein